MSTKDYSTELLGMEDVKLEKVEEDEQEIRLQLCMQRRQQRCPACGAETEKVHDYRTRRIRDLELRGKKALLLYRRRRYVCPDCAKRFSESCPFVGRYQRFTHRTTLRIIDLLHQRKPLVEVAKDSGTSLSGVCRVLDQLAVSRPNRLPEAISFDEFKGNLDGERFQCIVTDPLNRRVFDILPARTVDIVQEYLKSFPNRAEVRYAVMDMNKGFRDVARTFLPNARIIIDRFHVVRYCTEAMDDARRNVQKTLPKEQRRYFKRSRSLFLAHRHKLSDDDKAALDVMLRFSDRLAQAYALKEAFYAFMASEDRNTADLRLQRWFDACDRLQLPEFKACRRMLRNWREYILNAFEVRLSNGFTEGCNNGTKVLKRVSFGCSNFDRFRKRCLLSFSLHPNI